MPRVELNSHSNVLTRASRARVSRIDATAANQLNLAFFWQGNQSVDEADGFDDESDASGSVCRSGAQSQRARSNAGSPLAPPPPPSTPTPTPAITRHGSFWWNARIRHGQPFRIPFGGANVPGFRKLAGSRLLNSVQYFNSLKFGLETKNQSNFQMNSPVMYSSSSVMTMTSGPDGRPQVRQSPA